MNDAKLEKYVAHAALLDPRCANAVAMHDAELFTMPEYRRLRDAIVSLVEKNTDVIAERYKKLGGEILVIRKPGVEHHPHSLANPAPIVDFILEHTK